MATPLSFEALYALLKQCGLIELDLLKRTIKELFAAGLDREDVSGLLAAFVQKGMLTRWQADKLLAGKHKGFFLGKYRLLDLLGTGGMSSVYLAEHTVMRRRVAIKVLPQAKVNDSSYLERFHREAQAAAALDHRNIVRAYDVDQEGNIHFLVMEYVVGTSLLDLVKQSGPLDAVTAMEYTRQAAIGLQHAHTVGMVHRDIKPGNLLVDQYGTLKILDMGLAMFYDAGDTNSLTRKHDETVLGTVDYLSPEQAIDSHNVDARSDLYCLGGTLYFALVGHPPFPDGTPAQRLLAHQQKTPVPIRKLRPEVPEEVAAIAEKMLQKRPEDRYETATAVANECLKWLKAHGGSRWHELNPEDASRAMSDRGPMSAAGPATAAVAGPGTATVANDTAAMQASTAQTAAFAPANALASVADVGPAASVGPASTAAAGLAADLAPEADAAHIRSPESRPMVVARLIKRDAAKSAEPATDSKPVVHGATSASLSTQPTAVSANPIETAVDWPRPDFTTSTVEQSPAVDDARTDDRISPVDADEPSLQPVEDIVLPPLQPEPPAITTDADDVELVITAANSPGVAEAEIEDAVPEFSLPSFSPAAGKPVTRHQTVDSNLVQSPASRASRKPEPNRMLPAVIGGVAAVGILIAAIMMWPGKTPIDGKASTTKASTNKSGKKLTSANRDAGNKDTRDRDTGTAAADSAPDNADSQANVTGKTDQKSGRNVGQTRGQNDGRDYGKNESANTAASTSRPIAAGKPISVGNGGEYATLSDALAAMRKKSAPAAGSSIVRIELQPGLVIRERIVLDKSLPSRMQISAPVGEQVTVDVPGTDPCLEIIGGDGVFQRLRIEGLRFAGPIRPVTIRLSGQLDGLVLSRLSIGSFAVAGIEASGLVSYSKTLATIENCELRGESASSGIKFKNNGDQSCAAVRVSDCRFLGPMESGIWLEGAVADFDLHRNIFVETANGIRLDSSTPVWKRVSFGRNTFFKNGTGIGFARMPDEGTEGLVFANNLFVQTIQLPAHVAAGLDADRFRRTFIAKSEFSLRSNWTDSPSPGDAAGAPTLLDLFSTYSNRWGAENLGLDTDAASSGFLQPAPDSPLLTSGDDRGNPFGKVIGARP